MSEASSNVRRTYELLQARRAASPALAAVGAEVRDTLGLLSTDGSVRREEVERLGRALELGPARRLLDLGCGPGAPARYLAAATSCRVVGLDMMPTRVTKARAEANSAGLARQIEFLIVDLNASVPLATTSFDAAIVLDALIHIADKATLLAAVARMLRPGGRLALVSTTTEGMTAEQIAAAEETPGIWFGASQAALAALVERTGLAVLEVANRGELVRQMLGSRLDAMTRRQSDLARELGDDDFAVLLERQRTLAEFAHDGLLSSTLIVARRR